MIKVAITGNIASGKSCVEEYLKQLGYKLVDADKINHEILNTDKTTIKKIIQIFDEYDITDENNSISREKLGKIVFDNKEKLKELESILHKEISNKINAFFEENKKEKIVFVSAALLFESGFYKDYDKVIFVSAKEEIRLKRLITRNNYTIEYAKKRISSQDAEEQKIKKSDFVIENNSDLQSLKKQVEIILEKLIQS
ncbi:dephospho-CoA kinase [bacterium]|nr:dephospho-CoA kinase [bacterium]